MELMFSVLDGPAPVKVGFPSTCRMMNAMRKPSFGNDDPEWSDPRSTSGSRVRPALDSHLKPLHTFACWVALTLKLKYYHFHIRGSWDNGRVTTWCVGLSLAVRLFPCQPRPSLTEAQ